MRQISAPAVAGLTAALALLLAPGPAVAKTTLVELRVEGANRTLEPGAWYAVGSERIKRATPADECVPRAGATLFPGASALTTLASAQRSGAALRPVRYRTTAFGPQVCQIGNRKSFGHYPDASGGFLYWVDYVSGFSSADVAPVSRGQSVLWYEAVFPSDPPQIGEPSKNTGLPLELTRVPARDADGELIARVVAHDFDGSPSLVSDATITGAESAIPIGAGRYAITLEHGTSTLTAERLTDVPSNHVETCFRANLASCPRAHGRTIFGSDRGDRLRGTRGFDSISAGGGDDRVDLRAGGRDRVGCGPGDDLVRLRRGDRDDRIRRNCERVRRS